MTALCNHVLKLAVLSAALALGAAAPARAAYYLPTLDPVYGGPYPTLGWRAVGQLYVPDACEAAIGAGAFVLTPFGPQPDASCATAKLDFVNVVFYDTAAPLVPIETLNFGTFLQDGLPASTEDDVTQELLEISYLGGNVVGLKTSLSLPLQAFNGLVGGSSYFSLNFSSANGRLVEFGIPNPGSFADAVSVTGQLGQFDITRVPEPGTLALVLAAGGLIGWRRRPVPR